MKNAAATSAAAASSRGWVTSLTPALVTTVRAAWFPT
jgi:hypothetical protein